MLPPKHFALQWFYPLLYLHLPLAYIVFYPLCGIIVFLERTYSPEYLFPHLSVTKGAEYVAAVKTWSTASNMWDKSDQSHHYGGFELLRETQDSTGQRASVWTEAWTHCQRCHQPCQPITSFLLWEIWLQHLPRLCMDI